MFQGAQFRREDIHTFLEQEVIILRDEKVLGKVGKQLEYEDTTDTIRMRQELRDYNDLLAASFIDIATLQTPEIPKGESDNTSLPIRIQPETCRLRRVFSRGNWSMNGRFYGGWWQQVNDEWRSKIFIDDQPTIEVDFKGLHVAMLYAQLGKAMEHDPYKLLEEIGPEGEPECEGYPVNLARKLTKRLVLTAINAKGKSSAYKAFREGFSAGELGKAIRDKKLENLLQAFLQINPELEAFLFSDQGINLMYLDSQITAHIHNHFTQRSIPVLSVHDSYIIDHMRVAELRDVMAEASERVVGRPLATSIKLPDMPEYEHVSDEQLQEHIENRKGIRCVGYMDRLFTYQETTGRRVSPVVRGDAEEDYRLGLLR